MRELSVLQELILDFLFERRDQIILYLPFARYIKCEKSFLSLFIHCSVLIRIKHRATNTSISITKKKNHHRSHSTKTRLLLLTDIAQTRNEIFQS